MAKIVILNGSPRKNGKTASLVKAFVEGAESVWFCMGIRSGMTEHDDRFCLSISKQQHKRREK